VKTGTALHDATAPIRESEVFKSVSGTVKDVIDDGSSSRYGHYLDKEERRRQRELNEKKRPQSKQKKIDENPDAGESVVLHKDSAWKDSWNKFKDSSPILQSLLNARRTYEESENPLISATRSVTDRFANFFAENETARVIRAFREMDPNFQLEPFLKELREYIFPEVIDAYVKGDSETLKLWLGEAPYQVWATLAKQYTEQGLISDGKVLDIRGVDIVRARIIPPADIPVFIVTCRSQEVHMYRQKDTLDLVAGIEDRIQQCTYVAVITRIADEVANPETLGYRFLDMSRGATRNYT